MGYYLRCSYDDSLSRFNTYQGPNPASWFAEQLTVIAAWVQDLYENPVDMAPLTEEEEEKLRDPNTCCHICGKETATTAQAESAGPLSSYGEIPRPSSPGLQSPVSRQPDHSRRIP